MGVSCSIEQTYDANCFITCDLNFIIINVKNA